MKTNQVKLKMAKRWSIKSTKRKKKEKSLNVLKSQNPLILFKNLNPVNRNKKNKPLMSKITISKPTPKSLNSLQVQKQRSLQALSNETTKNSQASNSKTMKSNKREPRQPLSTLPATISSTTKSSE